MKELLQRLNRVQRGIAEHRNPNGYYRCMMPPPLSVGHLRALHELHDKHGASVPVRHDNPFIRTPFDDLAFYAAHDRYHIELGKSFEWDDEMEVFARQYADTAAFDPEAGKVQLAIMLTKGHWDRVEGGGFAPNAPKALEALVLRMQEDGAWAGFGTRQGNVFDAYDYLLPHLDRYMEEAR